jgi:hypothetical protein
VLTAVPKDYFTARYFIQEDGVPVGDLDVSRSILGRLFKGEDVVPFCLERSAFHLRAETAESAIPFLVKLKRLVLDQERTEIAWAEPRSLCHFSTVHWSGRRFELIGSSWPWRRKVQLLEAGAEAGVISRGYFSRRTTVEPPGDVALAVQSFMLWLALAWWQRLPD